MKWVLLVAAFSCALLINEAAASPIEEKNEAIAVKEANEEIAFDATQKDVVDVEQRDKNVAEQWTGIFGHVGHVIKKIKDMILGPCKWILDKIGKLFGHGSKHDKDDKKDDKGKDEKSKKSQGSKQSEQVSGKQSASRQRRSADHPSHQAPPAESKAKQGSNQRPRKQAIYGMEPWREPEITHKSGSGIGSIVDFVSKFAGPKNDYNAQQGMQLQKPQHALKLPKILPILVIAPLIMGLISLIKKKHAVVATLPADAKAALKKKLPVLPIVLLAPLVLALIAHVVKHLPHPQPQPQLSW